MPKRHRWRTLVHLHGRIQPEQDRSDLVLSSADFGRAYLTERWAARFVTALFRDFTVLFVGYSLSDPVMKYLVDAVAVERAKGDNLGMAYAFVGCDFAERAKVEAAWNARNVVPIVYDHKDDHALLHDTLRKWVDVRGGPQYRTRIALEGIRAYPDPGNPEIARVTWALEQFDAARELAQAPPFTDEEDFPKVERWLDVFDEAGLLSRTGRTLHLVDSGSRSQSPLRLDEVTRQLACWISRHLHVPQVLGWVLRKLGRIHPELRRELWHNLAKPAEAIPARLRHLWTVLLDEQVQDPSRLVYLEEQYKEADHAEKRRLEEVLLSSLVPRLTVVAGPSDRAVFRRLGSSGARPISPIEACGHLRVRLGHDGLRLDLMTLLSDPEFLCRHAERIAALLDDALVLLRHDDEVLTDPATNRARSDYPQWIAAGTDRFHSRHAWTRLIDLARDSYFALAKEDRARAAALLERWAQSEETTCKRLLLHALSEDDASEIGMAEAVLLRGKAPGIWDPYLRNEVLRFLNKAGSRLRPGLVKRLVRAIHTGPKITGPERHGIDSAGLAHAKVARLVELHLSGAKLDTESRGLVAETVAGRSADDFDDRNDVFAEPWAEVVRGDGLRARVLLDGPLADLQDVLCGEIDQLEWEDLDAVVRRGAAKVAEALRECAEAGKYPPEPWRCLMSYLASMRRDGNAVSDVEDGVARVLSASPDDLLANVAVTAADFVQAIGQAWGRGREPEFRVLWKRTWTKASSGVEIDNVDPVTRALNHTSGKLAEAAMFRLSKHEARFQKGLPPSVWPYFDSIATSPDAHPGRVLLAARLNYLFAIDPGWTEEQLIRRLDLSANPLEALDLWAGFAWSPSIGPNLLGAIKDSYLAVIARDDLPSRTIRGLVDLLIAICLGIPEHLTKREMRAAIEGLSEKSLCVALRSLERRLTGSYSERAQTWNDKIEPWLQDFWPREGSRNSTATSERMMSLVIGSGDGFPEAVSLCKPFLKPVEKHYLWRLVHLEEHIAKHPAAVLEFLSQVVLQELPRLFRLDLREMLKAVAGVQPELLGDPGFRRLNRIASGD